MTKKEMKKAQILAYKGYAEKVEIHQKAVRDCGINFGSHANLSEMVIKYAMNNYSFKGIAPSGHTDTCKKIDGEKCTIEIKTGGGELATIIGNDFKLMNGKRMSATWRNNKFDTTPKKNNCFKADYVVYIPEPDLTYPLTSQAYVLTGNDFCEILKNLGLIRYKQSTSASNQGLDYYDKFAIGDFKGSDKKYNALYDLLEEYGTGFEDWLESHDIEPAEID